MFARRDWIKIRTRVELLLSRDKVAQWEDQIKKRCEEEGIQMDACYAQVFNM